MESVLVVEDTDSLRQVLAQVLEGEGFRVQTASSAEDAVACLKDGSFSLILSDLKLPGASGIDLIQSAQKGGCTCPILVMTAYGSIDIAVQAMKIGATDFITKPFEPEKLVRLIQQVLEHRKLLGRNLNTARRQNRRLVTQSHLMEQVLSQCRKVAALSSNVMILGESGTGKELVARYIHDQSPRSSKEFIGVNCASMPGELLESEFFGHEIGAFTGATQKRQGLFELASKGTLFLDEIGTMPPELQIKLLRTLQESEIKPIGSSQVKKIDTRVLSATNCKIEEAIEEKKFREDLYYRLGVVIIEVPSLRDRKEDIELLSNYFLKRFASEAKRSVPSLSKNAVKKLQNHYWPGNVRELENVIERAMVFSNGQQLDAEDIELSGNELNSLDHGVTAERSLQEISQEAAKKAEVEAISQVMRETMGNKSKAARILGVSYKTLLNKVKDYNIES